LRRAARKDGNHDEIREEFRRLGCIVHDTLGDWDLTVEKHTLTCLVEVKDPLSAYGRKGLNPRQKKIPLYRWVIETKDNVGQCVAHLDAIAEAIRRAA